MPSKLTFSECQEGVVLLRQPWAGKIDFYLIIQRDEKRKRVMVRTEGGVEFWAPWANFQSATTQYLAEVAGARWRVAPQERPGLVGPARHPPHPHQQK